MSNSVSREQRVREPREYGGENSLFQPDEVLAYHFEAIRRKRELEPEQTLMLAVLEDAMACFQKHVLAKTPKAKTAFQEAENWILEDSEERLFSFMVICENLEIDPNWLRKGLVEWKKRKIEERARYRPAA